MRISLQDLKEDTAYLVYHSSAEDIEVVSDGKVVALIVNPDTVVRKKEKKQKPENSDQVSWF